jgi:hypothetical protein
LISLDSGFRRNDKYGLVQGFLKFNDVHLTVRGEPFNFVQESLVEVLWNKSGWFDRLTTNGLVNCIGIKTANTS